MLSLQNLGGVKMMRLKLIAVFFALAVFAMAANSNEENAVHWGYEGDGAPQFWAGLKPDFLTCGIGDEQSPININPAAVGNGELPGVDPQYQPSTLNAVNNGHTIQANVEPGSFIEIDGKRFDLLQFHFHAPSEHTISGRTFPMEMHLVHRSKDGGLAVIGVMIEEGASNAAFDPIWTNLPKRENDEIKVTESVNAEDLLPTDRQVYRYAGSLTTPPCSEGVYWNVLAESIQLSAAQIAAFTDIHAHVARPVQPFNERQFLHAGDKFSVIHQRQRSLSGDAILALLADSSAIYDSGAKQYFAIGGETLYRSPGRGATERGQWRVSGDDYCSSWGPSGERCYQMTHKGDIVMWDSNYPAKIVPGDIFNSIE